MEYSLDIEDFQKIPLDKYEKDFSFVVNGKEFPTNRILADILSPIIRRAHYQDPTFKQFIIKIEDINIEEATKVPFETYFEEFIQVGNYSKITLDSIHQKYYSYYFYALGNIKEYFRLQPQYFEEITIENVLEKIKFISKLLRKYPQETTEIEIYGRLIEFASKNFEQINKTEMCKLDINDIELIIKNENLKLNNEDSLMEFIIGLCECNKENSILFENVLFSYLTKEMIEKFIAIFDIEFLDWNTWKSICRRLTLTPTGNEEVNPARYANEILENASSKYKESEFKYDGNKKFNGILYYLTKKSKGNILENGTVGITTNSEVREKPLRNLVDFDSSDSTCYYRSEENPMAIITFDFKDRFVLLTNYAIQTGTWDSNQGHLKDWIIEGSLDGNKYDEIDCRVNDSSLRGNKYTSLFDVKHKETKFYHFIRLRQTGPASWNSEDNSNGRVNRFEISNIEFYGFLKEPSN